MAPKTGRFIAISCTLVFGLCAIRPLIVAVGPTTPTSLYDEHLMNLHLQDDSPSRTCGVC